MKPSRSKTTRHDDLNSNRMGEDRDWDKWEKIPKAELWKVVALSLNITPSKLLDKLNHRFDPLDPLCSVPRPFRERLEIAEAHLGEGLPEVEHRDTKDFGGNRRTYLSIVRLSDFASWAVQMDLELPARFPAARTPAPAPDWEAYKGRKSLTLHEAVALSLNLRLDFAASFEGEPCEGTAETSVSYFRHRVAIVRGHFDDGTVKARKTHAPDLEAIGLPPTWQVDLASFRTLAATKGWKLPPEFPGNEAESATSGSTATTAKAISPPPSAGVTVVLPHTTKALDKVFEVMRAFWTTYDPRNPPKQIVIAKEIDRAMDWAPQSDDKPSRNAEIFAAAIRPDPLAEADNRRMIRHRGKS